MKYLLVFLLIPFLGNSQDASSIVKFESETIHLGSVKKGDMVENQFVFTNISDADVEIDIVSTCVCTDAKWPQYPISPGDSATISFIFDSSQKDHVEPVEVDVYFINTNPKTGNPISAFLSYTFEWAEH